MALFPLPSVVHWAENEGSDDDKSRTVDHGQIYRRNLAVGQLEKFTLGRGRLSWRSLSYQVQACADVEVSESAARIAIGR